MKQISFLILIILSSFGLQSKTKTLVRVNFEGKYGYLNTRGDFEIEPIYDFAWNFSEELAAVMLDSLWGYIDFNGNTIIECQFEDALWFDEGFAAVMKNGKWGYIDKHGKVVVDFKYDDTFAFNEGMAKVEMKGLCGYIDKSGSIKIPTIYKTCYRFVEGKAVVYDTLEYQSILLNVLGDTIQMPSTIFPHDNILKNKNENKIFWNNAKNGFTDLNGKLIPFDEAQGVGIFKEGRSIIKIDGKYTIANENAEFLIPPIYDNMWHFHEGLASIAIDGEYGFINKKGDLTINNIYQLVGHFENGFSAVLIDGKVGYINKKGLIIIAPIFMETEGGRWDHFQKVKKYAP